LGRQAPATLESRALRIDCKSNLQSIQNGVEAKSGETIGSEPFVRSGGQVVPWNTCRAPQLVCQTHDECQGDVEAADVFVVKMPDQASDTFAPNRHGLIGHYLRSHS
jgi:hypothetical protein